MEIVEAEIGNIALLYIFEFGNETEAFRCPDAKEAAEIRGFKLYPENQKILVRVLKGLKDLIARRDERLYLIAESPTGKLTVHILKPAKGGPEMSKKCEQNPTFSPKDRLIFMCP